MHRLSQQNISLVLCLGLLLGSYRGFVALFENGKSEPREIFPYPVSSLPQDDQDTLRKGIPVPSEKALQHMLEDFMS